MAHAEKVKVVRSLLLTGLSGQTCTSHDEELRDVDQEQRCLTEPRVLGGVAASEHHDREEEERGEESHFLCQGANCLQRLLVGKRLRILSGADFPVLRDTRAS